MIRKQSLAALVAAAGLMIPSGAMALGISVTGFTSTSGTTEVRLGESITVDLVLENATLETVYGLGIAARGHDANNDGIANDGLVITGGQTAGAVFQPVTGIAGISNVLAPGIDLRGAPEQFAGTPSFVPAVPLHAQLFDGVGTTGYNFDGQADVGVGPNASVADGNVHFQVTFAPTANSGLTTLTPFTLEFGVFSDLASAAVGAGGSTLAFNNDSLAITVVPEPGTALLMGLGLAGLATVRRR